MRLIVGDQIFVRHPTVSCSKQSNGHALFEATVTSEEGESPDCATVEVTLPAELAWYLNARRELVELADAAYPPWPVGCFALIEHCGRLFQIRFDPMVHFRLQHGADRLTAAFTLRDRGACGLRLWGDHKLARSRLQHSLSIAVSRLEQLTDAVWTEPFPGSADSVICITDHPDWDSEPKAAALCDLFAATGLRITKGVFPSADPGWTYGPGLDSPAYTEVIDRWFETGHEIAYHGLGSGVHPPADLEECLRRIDRLVPYAPRTWIDHSCGDYTFARAAMLPDGADLLQTLSAVGVENYWSYADVWQNPATQLHVWRPRAVSSTFEDTIRLGWRRGLTGPLQLAYLGSIPIKSLTGDTQYRRVMRQPWSRSQWSDLGANYRLIREIVRGPLCLYGLSGDFFLRNPGGVMVFDTILLNHLALQLRPSSLERLARDNGILIAHTYLAADQKKGGRNCFKVGNETEFVAGFRENVEHISALQKRGRTVTLPLRDLREALVRHATSSIVRTAEGWEVHGDAIVASHAPYRILGKDMARDHHGVHTAAVSRTAVLAAP